ncbi:hypothetical protein NPIL_683731 [Nephila pilipes]|uniref:Uncharacterized protein n=1 Tax=Nephila pilipes TaxID=299642 RepID=A0A8X6TTG9_NEPPI|nr:hypothetical protein NPIL_683731 [Nephila pilipes]
MSDVIRFPHAEEFSVPKCIDKLVMCTKTLSCKFLMQEDREESEGEPIILFSEWINDRKKSPAYNSCVDGFAYQNFTFGSV